MSEVGGIKGKWCWIRMILPKIEAGRPPRHVLKHRRERIRQFLHWCDGKVGNWRCMLIVFGICSTPLCRAPAEFPNVQAGSSGLQQLEGTPPRVDGWIIITKFGTIMLFET